MLERLIESENFDDFFGKLSEDERKNFCKAYFGILKVLSESNITYMTKNAIIMEIIKSVFFLEADSNENSFDVATEMELSERIASFFSMEPKIIDRYIKKLKYQKVKTSEEIRAYMEKVLFLTDKNYELVLDKRKIRYFINDDFAKEQVERFLRKNGVIHDTSFNKNIIEIGQDSFVLLLENFLSEENKNKICKELNIANFKEFLKENINSIFEQFIGIVGGNILDLIKIAINRLKSK